MGKFAGTGGTSQVSLSLALPTPLEQCERSCAELEATGVVVKLIPGESAKIALDAIYPGRHFTVLPAEEWGTADGAELLRQSIQNHRRSDEEWTREKAEQAEQLAQRSA